MTETIKLMKAHTSVRRFKEQALPQEDLTEPFANLLFSFSLSEI